MSFVPTVPPRFLIPLLCNIGWESNEESLRDYFGQYGRVSDCVIMRDRQSGHPRGFGFVSYDDEAVADRVAAERHELDGRQVEAKRAVPRSECVPTARTHLRATKKVFVGGLPSTCGDKEFYDYFARFGDIAESQVMYDHQTSNSRGFGFVTFSVETTVDRVVNMDHEIMGKFVEVKRAEPKQVLEARRNNVSSASSTSNLTNGHPGPTNSSSQPGTNVLTGSPLSLSAQQSFLQSMNDPAAFAAVAAAAAAAGAAPPTALSALHMATGHPLQSSPYSSFASPQAPWTLSSSSQASPISAPPGSVAASLSAAHLDASGPTPATTGMGYYAQATSYPPEIAQFMQRALYGPSFKQDSPSFGAMYGIPSARAERRMHPYSLRRERVERSYR